MKSQWRVKWEKKRKDLMCYIISTHLRTYTGKKEGNISKYSGCGLVELSVTHSFSFFSVFSKSSVISMHFFHKFVRKVTLYIRKKIQVIRELGWLTCEGRVRMTAEMKGSSVWI